MKSFTNDVLDTPIPINENSTWIYSSNGDYRVESNTGSVTSTIVEGDWKLSDDEEFIIININIPGSITPDSKILKLKNSDL